MGIHCCGAGIVCSQCLGEVSAIPRQQQGEIPCASSYVLCRIPWIVNAKLNGSLGHELHEPHGTLPGDSPWVEIRFHFDDAPDKERVNTLTSSNICHKGLERHSLRRCNTVRSFLCVQLPVGTGGAVGKDQGSSLISFDIDITMTGRSDAHPCSHAADDNQDSFHRPPIVIQEEKQKPFTGIEELSGNRSTPVTSWLALHLREFSSSRETPSSWSLCSPSCSPR